MARIDSVVNNFANHVTSGLCDFILTAFEACERADTSRLTLVLHPNESIAEPFASDVKLAASTQRLREKFAEILARGSHMELHTNDRVVVDVDFALHSTHFEERRRWMAAIPVYDGYNPVYCCTVSVRLDSGVERTVIMYDPASAVPSERSRTGNHS